MLLILFGSLVSPAIHPVSAIGFYVRVYNVDNLPLPGPGTIYVDVYDENSNWITWGYVHVNGGESYEQIYISSSNITDGNLYYFVVSYINDDDTLEPEIWTIVGYYVHSGDVIPLIRDEPYISGGITVSAYDVNPGETIRVDVTVKNPNEYYSIPTKVHVRIDKDKYSPYDSESYSSTLTLSPGETQTFTVYVDAPQEAGDYYIHAWVEDTELETATDQITWDTLNQIHVKEVINAEITYFDVTDITLTPPDDDGDAVVQVKNTGNVETTFHVDLAAYPATGGYVYIIDSTSVTLDAGETSSYLYLNYDYDGLNLIAGPGEYNLYVLVHTGDPLSPLATSSEKTVTVEEPHPYFEIVSFSFDKDVYYIGEDITATVTIKNTGTATGTINTAEVVLDNGFVCVNVDSPKTDITLNPGEQITLTFRDNTEDMGLSPGTYTGEAAVLWYDDGELKSNSKTVSGIEIKPPRVSLTVEVYNIYKNSLPPNPGTIYVELYSISGDSWSYVTEQQVSFNGGEDYVSVTFSELDPEMYYGIRVWQDPEGGVKEFWGQMEIGTLSSSRTVEFVRNTLYSDPSWVTFEPSTNLNAGDKVHISIRVDNPGTEPFSGTVNFYLDRDGEYPYDYSELVGIPTVSPGTSLTVDIGDFTIPEGGTYYFMYEINTYVPGVGTVPSDQITEWAYAFDAQGPEEVKWVIMVYLDGDNNLEALAIDDFLEMAQVGSTDEVKIVVLFDRNGKDEAFNDPDNDSVWENVYTAAYGDWRTTKLFEIERGKEPTAENALEDWDEANMGDPQTLVRFVKWVYNKYPNAEHYALILFNHGGGWIKPNEPSPGVTLVNMNSNFQHEVNAASSPQFPEGIAYDEENGTDAIELDELNEALKELKDLGIHLDLIAFEACIMQMAETLAEIHDVYPDAIVVGSEEVMTAYFEQTIPVSVTNSLYEYDEVLQQLVDNPSMSPENLAIIMAESYEEYISSESLPFTISVVDLSHFDELVNSINAFVSAVQDSKERTCLVNARDNSIRFANGYTYYNHYMDLGDFIYLVSTCTSSPEIQEKANDVLTALNNMVIAKWDQGYERNTWGISIELPIDYGNFEEYSSWHYNYLTFASESQWDELIEWGYNPEIEIVSPSSGESIPQGDDLVLSFVVDGKMCKITEIKYCIDDSCTQEYTSDYWISYSTSIDTSYLELGYHTVTVYAETEYGQELPGVSRVFEIEEVDNPPEISVISPSPGIVIQKGTPLTLTVQLTDDKGLSKIEVYLDSLDNLIDSQPLSGASWLYNKTFDTSQEMWSIGYHDIIIKVTDTSEKNSNVSVGITITENEPQEVHLYVSNVTIPVGGYNSARIWALEFPTGLSGYRLRIEFNPSLINITNVEFPPWATLYDVSEISYVDPEHAYLTIQASDLNDLVVEGSKNVTLAILNISAGDIYGEVEITVIPEQIDDDSGDLVNVIVHPGSVNIIGPLSPIPDPSVSGPPTDIDHDGLYEDLNGNGRIDFNDLVLFFQYMEWIQENWPADIVDFNHNGRVDFNDIVVFFQSEL